MKAYGKKYLYQNGTSNPVTADRWPPYVQINVARKAHETRGFGPWPSTARACGLL